MQHSPSSRRSQEARTAPPSKKSNVGRCRGLAGCSGRAIFRPAGHGGSHAGKRRGEAIFFSFFVWLISAQALLISKLAYSPSELRKYPPLEAAKQGLLLSQSRTKRVMVRSHSLPAADVAEATRMHTIGSQLQVLAATLDCVAYVRTNPASRQRTLIIGFRGTGMFRDLVPDAQLAFNAAKIRRLDEARAFTRQVRTMVPDIPESRLHLYGHSLGGFIAEGVGNDLPQARTISIEPGAPVFGNMARPRSFNAPAPGAQRHTRLVRPGDPVTMGDRNLNSGEEQITEPRVQSMDPLRNHFLSAYMPWLAGPDLKRRIVTSVRWGIDRAKVRTSEAVKRFQDATRNAADNLRRRV